MSLLYSLGAGSDIHHEYYNGNDFPGFFSEVMRDIISYTCEWVSGLDYHNNYNYYNNYNDNAI